MKQPIENPHIIVEEDPDAHVADSDCAPYLDTLTGDGNECSVCGVYHGDPCPQCNGRGFHKLDCTWETL